MFAGNAGHLFRRQLAIASLLVHLGHNLFNRNDIERLDIADNGRHRALFHRKGST
jgi:hypothetical protein